MQRNLKHVFGQYDPYIADSDLWKIKSEYIKSEYFKSLKREESIYLLEKWNFLRNFFEAENLYHEIQEATYSFIKKWDSQQRKIYHEKNADKIRQQQREGYHRNREIRLLQCKKYSETHKEQIYEKKSIMKHTEKK